MIDDWEAEGLGGGGARPAAAAFLSNASSADGPRAQQDGGAGRRMHGGGLLEALVPASASVDGSLGHQLRYSLSILQCTRDFFLLL